MSKQKNERWHSLVITEPIELGAKAFNGSETKPGKSGTMQSPASPGYNRRGGHRPIPLASPKLEVGRGEESECQDACSLVAC